MDLRVANGARVAALAVGSCQLELPSRLVLNLDKCYYVPSLSKNIISISCLVEQGFKISISKSKGCSIYLDGMFYCSGMNINGIYVLDNQKEIHNVNTKRLKINNLKPSYLWHYRLGHINETRMSKLHKQDSLGSFDYESYETCESCLLDKMTKSPFTGKGERASGLLELIHSDVCGPMTTHARGGFLYFITFIDDFSRFGYVFLMKHKSEVFEKFKEFR